MCRCHNYGKQAMFTAATADVPEEKFTQFEQPPFVLSSSESDSSSKHLVVAGGHVLEDSICSTAVYLKFHLIRTLLYCFCDRSVREKAWRSHKRVAQAT